jgi:hypothetical protein
VSRLQSLAAGAIASVALVTLTAIHLDSQGISYDELHQAPAAFCYVGSHPPMFTRAYHGVPILNMTYSGAIKSAVYGAYLRYVSPHFSIVAWRSIGIAFVAAGLLLFFIIAGPSLPLASAGVFLCLFLSDVSVIVMTRHDSGPTALAQALRLAFLALWLSAALEQPRNLKLAAAGFVVGISIWEKLSSIVLLAPLCMLVVTISKRRRRAWLPAALGFFAGTLPLLVTNVGTYAAGKGLISLRDASPDRAPASLRGLAEYAYHFLSLGQGHIARVNVTGDGSGSLDRAESLLMGALMLGVCLMALRARGPNRLMALAATMAGAYASLAAALAILPRETAAHHWIIGTPFQYAAIGLAVGGLKGRGAFRRLLLVACAGLVVIRAPALVEVEKAFVSGRSSTVYSPAFKRLAQLAAAKSRDAAFIASDWGSATQIYCGADGRDDTVYEPFWRADPGRAATGIAEKTRKRTLYVVTTGMGPPRLAEASSAILEAMARAPGWQSVPAGPNFSSLGPVQVRKFVRKSD